MTIARRGSIASALTVDAGPGPTQFARPDSTLASANWTVTGAASHHAALSETVASDSEFVRCGVASTLDLGLSDVSDPSVGTGHVFRVRALRNNGNATMTALELRQGASTVIKAMTFTWGTNGAFTTREFTLSEAEANAITDYTDLRARIAVANTLSNVDVSWVELEVPGA